MNDFQVFNDLEEEKEQIQNKHALLRGKLKSAKADLGPRSVLADIDNNKVLDNKHQPSKFKVFEDKDVSEAFKDVKLDSIEDKSNKEEVKKRLPLIERDVNVEESSDESLDLSYSDIKEEVLASEQVKLQTERFYSCVEYRDDIYSYLRQLETVHRPKPMYMRKQPDITYSMRSILVDWLVEVSEEYKLQGETLFRAVSFVDRFLSSMAVLRTKLQLLGTSAMFLSSKYEEIYPPEVGEFAYITDDTYTKKQILRMEQLLCKTLNFDISAPTTHTFIIHLSQAATIDPKVTTLAMYICELTLLEGDPFFQYSPSLVACGAIALARHCLHDVDVWPSELSKISGYSLRHLSDVLSHLNNTHSKAPNNQQTSTRDKYKTHKLDGVALIPHKSLIVRVPDS